MDFNTKERILLSILKCRSQFHFLHVWLTVQMPSSSRIRGGRGRDLFIRKKTGGKKLAVPEQWSYFFGSEWGGGAAAFLP